MSERSSAEGRFPFLDHIGLVVREHEPGSSTCALTVAPFHFNSSGLVHGAVIFALADTGMGAALMGTLAEGEGCATVELQINYFKPGAGWRTHLQHPTRQPRSHAREPGVERLRGRKPGRARQRQLRHLPA